MEFASERGAIARQGIGAKSLYVLVTGRKKIFPARVRIRLGILFDNSRRNDESDRTTTLAKSLCVHRYDPPNHLIFPVEKFVSAVESSILPKRKIKE